jgi:TonB family protein
MLRFSRSIYGIYEERVDRSRDQWVFGPAEEDFGMREPLRYFLALSLLLPPSTVQQIPASFAAILPVSSVFQKAIPEATEACTDDEAKWWEKLRAAGFEFAAASRRKDLGVRAGRTQASHNGKVLSDDDDGLSREERDSLNADLETAGQNYFRLLRQGTANSFRAPIRDTERPVMLHNSYPFYSEAARRNHTQGSVKLRVEFRADGTIGEVKVHLGLGDGLDRQSIQAIRRSVFLPATRDRAFVTISIPAEIEFHLT